MTTGAPVVPSKPKTSGLAIASLILGIVGGCSLGVLSIVGLVLGIVAAKKIKASGGAMGGRGMAVAGIVLSIVTLILGLVLAALGWYGITGACDMANSASSANNVKQLCSATMQYATSHRQKLPPADTWPEVFQQQVGLSPQVMADPADEKGGRAYAMNAALAGGTLVAPDPGRTVLFFECRPGAPACGGQDLLPEKPRHANLYVIGFLDGHVESVPPENIRGLIWEPKPGL